LPNIFQVDKLSALGSTIEYVKQLEEKLKALEEQSARTTSTFFGNKCRVVPAEKNDDLLDSADIATSAGGSNSNPTVEAIVYADTVLLKICCKDKRGVLVVVLPSSRSVASPFWTPASCRSRIRASTSQSLPRQGSLYLLHSGFRREINNVCCDTPHLHYVITWSLTVELLS
jgi:hypothetical protein